MKLQRGQMFILATMLIAVYIVAMTAALTQFGLERTKINREILNEPFLDSKREIQHFFELLLAEYSKGDNLITRDSAISLINELLSSMETIFGARGVTSEFHFFPDSFLISATLPPYENTTEEGIYTSAIFGEFSLTISTISSSITIDEAFNVSFLGQVELRGNSVHVQQTLGNHLFYTKPSSIFILNGTIPIYPTADTVQTGIYYFSTLSNFQNVGILNVTLSNGVRIFS